MKIVAPYGIRIDADGKIEITPVVEVRVCFEKDRSFLGIFVIDSGASVSLLPAFDAVILGIKWKTGEKIHVRGISGRQLLGYKHNVDMAFDGAALHSVSVIFVGQKNVPRVLGREGVFSRFGILFDEAKKRTAFLEITTERELIDSLIE